MSETPAATSKRAGDLAWYFESFPRFCSLLDVVPKGGQRIPFKLSGLQRRYIAAATQRDIILKPRQVGMTTLMLAWMVYYFLTVRGARVVIVCQSMTGNGPIGNIAATVRVYFDSLRRAGIKLEFSTERSSEWSIRSRDASVRIVVAGASETSAAKVGRSGTVTHLMCTETAFWEYAEDTTNALFECVPGERYGSVIVSESTANGAQGLFHQQCASASKPGGSSAYTLHFFNWYDEAEYRLALRPGETIEAAGDRERLLVSRGVGPEQLKWYRQKVADKGQSLTDQEYPSDPDTCFLVSGRSFFDAGTTGRLLEKAGQPIERRERDQIAIWKKAEPGKQYILSIDTSEGGGGDPSAGIMRERETGEHVATINGQYQMWELAASAAKLATEYNQALIAVERNNHGNGVHEALLRQLKYPKVYKHDDNKHGWPTNSATRPAMLDALEDAYRNGHWQSRDRNVLTQFKNFIITDTGRAEAARGEHDDLVMAEAIGWAVRARPVFRYGAGPQALADY